MIYYTVDIYACEYHKLCAMSLNQDTVRAIFNKYVVGDMREDKNFSTYHDDMRVVIVKVVTDNNGIVVSETVISSAHFCDQRWWQEDRADEDRRYHEN